MSQKDILKKYNDENIIEMAKANHIWLNAFHCIEPTDEFARDLGMVILKMLDKKHLLLDDEGFSKKLIISLNKS